MNEPRLKDISDYDRLKGQKKKVVWSMFIAWAIICVVYIASNMLFGEVNDKISTTDPIINVKLK